MSISNEITFHGYKISANAHPDDDDHWVGSYVIVIDEQQTRSRDFVIRHISEVAAKSGALLRGLQFVELVLMPEAEIIALHASGVPPRTALSRRSRRGGIAYN